DTEVSVQLFDLWDRVYKYPLEYIIEALAPTTEMDFDCLSPQKQRIYRQIQAAHIHASPDGPWFFIIARSHPDIRRLQLMGITDTSMLRPQVFALSDSGEAQIALICSEKQAIDATLRSLAREDKRFCPVADKYWNARGGSHTDGGAFIFSVVRPEGGRGPCTLTCTDKFGREVTLDVGSVRCDTASVEKIPNLPDISEQFEGKLLHTGNAQQLFNEVLSLPSWSPGGLRSFCDAICKTAHSGKDRATAIEALTLMYDRRFDTGDKRRSTVLQVIEEAIQRVFDSVPLFDQPSVGFCRRIDWATRESLRAPAGDEEDETDLDEDTPDSESDWIELYNTGAEPVNLTGWSLTDDADKPRKWYFPAGSSIPAGGYLIVMATGFNIGPTDGATYLHTNFKLGKEGEYVGLVDAGGAVASAIAPAYPRQNAFHVYARTFFGSYVYGDTATPGAANAGTTFSAITPPPVFSHLGGFHAASFPLQLASPDPAAVIRYTTDGRVPSETVGTVYSAPITLTAATTVRARCFKAWQIPSDTVTHSFLVAQSSARQTLPALCVSGDPVLTFYGPNASGGPANGEGIMAIKGGSYVSDMWVNLGDMNAFNMPMQNGRHSERPAGFEYYPTSGVALRTEVGLRISGSGHARPRYRLTTAPAASFSTTDFKNKPSFNYYFRGELGESPQNYAFFPESRVTLFEDMRLRAGKNDVSNPFIKDELMRRIYIGTGQKGSRGTFVSLYINSVWKGYYNLCEHLREAFMQQQHGSAALWDVVQVGAFASGDSVHWNTTITFLRTNDLTVSATYAMAQEYVDVDNIADYVMCNAYAAMWDWPNNNWVAARERAPQGRWRFYMWDAEGCFGADSRNPATYDSFIGDRDGDGVGSDSNTVRIDIGDAAAIAANAPKDVRTFYTRLRSSPEFRLRFADRAQKHLFHGGCLTRESMQATYTALRDLINPIMREAISASMNETFYNAWIVPDTRRNTFFTQLVRHGLWPATRAPEFSQHGGEVTTNTWITISNPNGGGTVYWTANGADPRALGGAPAGTPYAGPMQFPATATLKARVLSAGGEWSPLQEAVFIVPLRVPFFVPPGNADWTVADNWSTFPQPYPDGVGAEALIPPPTTASREANLRAPVTVGGLTLELGSSPYRNKISDSGTTNVLTFTTTNAAAHLTVTGNGDGYGELEITAGVVLGTNLTVTVTAPAGNALYGALRLKEAWSGPGGLTKEGIGRVALTGDGKTYRGPTVVNQGVLQVTANASPERSAMTVNPGGQLRLASASTAGEPRIYNFGGDLTLNSRGRGGDLPAVPGLGIEGGLRFEPESNDSAALITNRLVMAGPSALHVENARNTLHLTGAVLGP
ncbi:MAG TPA: CotH kinase family protein, partial [Kiritimatiellia bacterium]|nr:CotH kinase family protein [Kiritimatiellia bacterium]